MKPSNPGTFFISGNEEAFFTYEPGCVPYYCIAHNKSYVALSVIVFAESEAHVREILRELADFAARSVEQYKAAEAAYPDKHGFQDRYTYKRDLLRKIADGDPAYDVEIGLVNTSQLHKIGWASNDTL